MFKKILSFICSAIISWFVLGSIFAFIVNVVFKSPDIVWLYVIFIILWLFSLLLLYRVFYGLIFKNVKTIKEYSQQIVATSKDIIHAISNIKIEDANLYNIAENEIDSGNVDKDLWSLALVMAQGDENMRKVEYIKLRVKQIKKIIK